MVDRGVNVIVVNIVPAAGSDCGRGYWEVEMNRGRQHRFALLTNVQLRGNARTEDALRAPRKKGLSNLVRAAIAFMTGCALASSVFAQHQIEENAENRTTVAVHVDERKLSEFLPSPWEIDVPASGPWQGADLLLEYRDRIMNLDEHKQPISGGSERGLVLLVPAKNPKTGDAGLRVIREYTANPNFLPGLYNNSKLLLRMQLLQTLKADGYDSGITMQSWDLEEADGGVANLRLEYARGVPKRVNRTYKMFGSSDPSLIRIYHSDQGVDVVKDVAAGIDRTTRLELKVTMKELSPMFDGSQRLVSVEVVPWYLREVSVP